MKIKATREHDYQIFAETNSKNGYSYGVVTYIQRWADMMESLILNEGLSVSEAATKTEHEADREGITGFMYGCAVNALSQLWEYGEELRKWHNKDYGYNGDGVVNPAILNIKL